MSSRSIFKEPQMVPGYGGVQLAVYETSPAVDSMCPVILLHGLLSSAQSMSSAMGMLQEMNVRAIALDLRSHGRSDVSLDPHEYLNQAMARDVVGVVERLDINRFCVIAYGLGAELTARIWNLGTRFQRAAICGWGGPPSRQLDLYASTEWKLRARTLAHGLEVDQVSAIRDPEAKAWRHAADRSGTNRSAIAAKLRSGDSRENGLDPTFISAPVLAICGEDDASSAEFASALPNANSKTVTGAHTTAGQIDDLWRAATQFVVNC